MVVSIKLYVFIIFILVLTLLFPNIIPQEQTFHEAFENITSINNEAIEPTPEQEPLMSIIDDTSTDDEESGWWKHDGHSIVSYASSEGVQNIINVNESNERSDNDEDSNEVSEDEEETDEDNGDTNQEIPKFPTILLPFMIALCIAMFFRK
ncbi:hypothetical protein [Methanolobus sp. ZRKC5]|uniref:hypothetical protein n=1 Tax=unclassified Methanolobus TaxID=2629569 RepID=UPI00313BB9BC